jgi:hypothetical protein
MVLRFLRLRRARRRWSAPQGATAVLQWLPSALLEASPAERGYLLAGYTGWREIQPIAAFLAGDPQDDAPDEPGPPDRDEAELRGFTDACFGEGAIMTPFGIDIDTGEGTFAARAYWLTEVAGP